MWDGRAYGGGSGGSDVSCDGKSTNLEERNFREGEENVLGHGHYAEPRMAGQTKVTQKECNGSKEYTSAGV